MTCHNCKTQCGRFGRDRKGYQRFRCSTCSKTFTEPHNGTVHGMYATVEKAATVIRLLVEGNSIRSIERITGMHRDTTMRLLLRAFSTVDPLFQQLETQIELAI